MVLESVTARTYRPFAAAGLARTMFSMKAERFSFSWSSEKETLPIGAWTLPVLSTRNSILPALISRTARATSKVTVPAFGRRHQAARAEDAAELTDLAHLVRRGDRDVEVEPPILDLLHVLAPTKSAPASSASRALSPCAMTSTRAVFPVPCGRTTVPRTIWSA
jgi:hypothetical protein